MHSRLHITVNKCITSFRLMTLFYVLSVGASYAYDFLNKIFKCHQRIQVPHMEVLYTS